MTLPKSPVSAPFSLGKTSAKTSRILTTKVVEMLPTSQAAKTQQQLESLEVAAPAPTEPRRTRKRKSAYPGMSLVSILNKSLSVTMKRTKMKKR
jgi:hypothetical protein